MSPRTPFPVVLWHGHDDRARIQFETVADSIGAAVRVIHDTATVAEACLEGSADAIVLDVVATKPSAADLVQRIVSTVDVPIVVIAPSESERATLEALEAGAMWVLVKPIPDAQIPPALWATLKRSREVRALRGDIRKLETGLRAKQVISLATGILMERLDLSAVEAAERLRRIARSGRRRILEVAQEVLDARQAAADLFMPYRGSRGI